MTASETDSIKHTQLHGHRVAYRQEGSGPLIVLVHGITSSSATWERVMPALAERYTVIAPDLLGHGQSAKPRGDYSLGAYASGLRDLLVSLGHERATFVGIRWAGGWRCSSPTSSPSSVNGSCWSTAAASVAR